MADSLFIDPARRHGQEGFAVVGGIGTGYESNWPPVPLMCRVPADSEQTWP